MSDATPGARLRRIGIFGGSFDPVHAAHLALARVARDHLALDELRWVPVGMPWQKARELAPAADRLAMVALAIEGEPGFTLDRSELDRPGPSYTVDTVRDFQQREPHARWWLILGQDQYGQLDSWQGWREIVERVTLAIAAREGEPPQPPAALAGVAHRCVTLPLPAMAISSTALRDAIDEGRGIDGMVPPPVARYIARHRLYRRTT